MTRVVTRRIRRMWAAVLGAALACLLVAAVPAVAAPVWRIDSLSNTNVVAGGTLEYLVQITNGGNVATDGSQIVLSGRLAPGMSVVGASFAQYS